jgi:hypothetical protein
MDMSWRLVCGTRRGSLVASYLHCYFVLQLGLRSYKVLRSLVNEVMEVRTGVSPVNMMASSDLYLEAVFCL